MKNPYCVLKNKNYIGSDSKFLEGNGFLQVKHENRDNRRLSL